MRYYLGLATTFHDPALALIGPDGTVLFAEGAERFLQYKRAPNCEPDPATRMVGLLAELVPEGSELVVASTWGQQFTEFLEGQGRTGAFTLEALGRHAPVLNRSFVPERAERIFVAEMAIAQARAGYGTLLALDQETRGRGGAARARIVRQDRFPHHLTHAAYALWGSPFSDATAVIVDGMGETGAAALYRMEAGRIAEVRRHRGRGSVGFLYGLVTDLAGFDQLKGEEWKIMGLAPYGRSDPALVAQLRRLYTAEGGRLKFTDDATVRDVVATILSRRPADLGEAGWADLARSGQEVFSELMDILVAEAWALSPHENLVIAGGCGLNSSYNGRVLERSSFSRLHVPSAPGDDGNAVGAAWLAYAADNPGWTGPAPE
ncbi:carbamoyltransferase N-terminal domain-containing protein, partial [Methylobacterium sp. WL6]|uniref:carbamoyltransferase N-terminal domain-containing protein n=3 Tax=Methylobacterium TaxID=407 RepID=UPI0011D5826E